MAWGGAAVQGFGFLSRTNRYPSVPSSVTGMLDSTSIAWATLVAGLAVLTVPGLVRPPLAYACAPYEVSDAMLRLQGGTAVAFGAALLLS